MGKWRLLALGIGLYLIFLVVTLPAQFAYSVFKIKLAPQAPLVLDGVSGTVWSGRAAPASISGQRVDSVTWELQPWSLLIGRIQAKVEFRYGDSFGKADIARGLTGKIYAKNIEARIALQRMRLLTQMLPLGMEGSLLLNLSEFVMDRRSIVEAAGVLAWDGAVITVPQRTEFGNLRATISTENDSVKVVLSDGGGALQAEGVLNLAPEGNYKFTGAFAARDQSQRMLLQGLQMLGRPGADGKVTITTNGALSQLFSFFEKPEVTPATK